MNVSWKVDKNEAIHGKEPQEDNIIINQVIMTKDNNFNLS